MLHEDFSSFTLLSNYSAAVLLSSFSRVRLCATLWTVVYQAPLSMGFSRQEYWSGLPFPSPGGLPGLGIEPISLMSPALASRFFTTRATGEARHIHTTMYKMGFPRGTSRKELTGQCKRLKRYKFDP